MNEPNRNKLLKLNTSQRPSLIKNGKGVHMVVPRPVIDEYNSITLDKTAKYSRIKHKSTLH